MSVWEICVGGSLGYVFIGLICSAVAAAVVKQDMYNAYSERQRKATVHGGVVIPAGVFWPLAIVVGIGLFVAIGAVPALRLVGRSWWWLVHKMNPKAKVFWG